METTAFIESVTAGLADDTRVRGLFLGGSLGRGTADEWSDIDFVITAAPADQLAVATAWRSLLASIAPIVFWNQMDGERLVLNAITADWLRCDVAIQPAHTLLSRAKDRVKPLIDRDGLYDALPDTMPPKAPNPGYISYVIHEFIRMLGLMPVAVGRGELVTMALGLGMMRDHVAGLMMQSVTDPDPGGILHQSKVLSPEDMAVLRALPYPPLEQAALINANLAIARQFMPRARALAEQSGIPWPADFEAATRRRLNATLGPDTIAW
ncbi:MAG: nucleotidyltransferase domain-containing protein [Alphaproteobacteria bacterium]|nr:nucleotidyltransferase domain-containing protein [Alphaproteobacteria bacterium]